MSTEMLRADIRELTHQAIQKHGPSRVMPETELKGGPETLYGYKLPETTIREGGFVLQRMMVLPEIAEIKPGDPSLEQDRSAARYALAVSLAQSLLAARHLATGEFPFIDDVADLSFTSPRMREAIGLIYQHKRNKPDDPTVAKKFMGVTLPVPPIRADTVTERGVVKVVEVNQKAFGPQEFWPGIMEAEAKAHRPSFADRFAQDIANHLDKAGTGRDNPLVLLGQTRQVLFMTKILTDRGLKVLPVERDILNEKQEIISINQDGSLRVNIPDLKAYFATRSQNVGEDYVQKHLDSYPLAQGIGDCTSLEQVWCWSPPLGGRNKGSPELRNFMENLIHTAVDPNSRLFMLGGATFGPGENNKALYSLLFNNRKVRQAAKKCLQEASYHDLAEELDQLLDTHYYESMIVKAGRFDPQSKSQILLAGTITQRAGRLKISWHELSPEGNTDNQTTWRLSKKLSRLLNNAGGAFVKKAMGIGARQVVHLPVGSTPTHVSNIAREDKRNVFTVEIGVVQDKFTLPNPHAGKDTPKFPVGGREERYVTLDGKPYLRVVTADHVRSGYPLGIVPDPERYAPILEQYISATRDQLSNFIESRVLPKVNLPHLEVLLTRILQSGDERLLNALVPIAELPKDLSLIQAVVSTVRSIRNTEAVVATQVSHYLEEGLKECGDPQNLLRQLEYLQNKTPDPSTHSTILKRLSNLGISVEEGEKADSKLQQAITETKEKQARVAVIRSLQKRLSIKAPDISTNQVLANLELITAEEAADLARQYQKLTALKGLIEEIASDLAYGYAKGTKEFLTQYCEKLHQEGAAQLFVNQALLPRCSSEECSAIIRHIEFFSRQLLNAKLEQIATRRPGGKYEGQLRGEDRREHGGSTVVIQGYAYPQGYPS